MVQEKLFLVLGCILHMHSALALWSCSVDSDCYSVVGSVCTNGACVCPPGKQNVLGGLACADVAPYHFSQCVENFQCSRLFTTFECRRSNGTDAEGNCFCTPGNHYFRGRCWTNIDEGQACTHDQQCLGGLRDPFSMVCRGTCECADGYYLRQRGECRRIGAAVGAGCVLDEDCQFEGGACNPTTFQCFDANAETDQNAEGFVKPHAVPEEKSLGPAEPSNQRDLQGYGAPCNSNAQCMDAFECSSFGICTCPLGYYPNAPRTNCLAELGSPAEPNQCVGLFTEIRDGICTCQTNFYFNEDMRTCVKAARFITDACLVDENCHTFGAQSRCGEPQLWGLRSCECITEYAQWDANRNMCRLFARIGEECEEDSDCLAGEMEVSCVADAQGQGRCECPPGLTAVGELCLQLGLELGDACQVDLECTGTENTVCTNGLCSCTAGYQPDGDVCAPVIGGTCATTSDCVIENTVCAQDTLTCQCDQLFVEQEDICWPVAEAHNASCTIDAQCVAGVGAGAGCVNGACACAAGYHLREGMCWAITGLFETCSRSSQCYLADLTDRVECRNSLCQCSFDYPYSEELQTCVSSASAIFSNSIVIISALFYLLMKNTFV